MASSEYFKKADSTYEVFTVRPATPTKYMGCSYVGVWAEAWLGWDRRLITGRVHIASNGHFECRPTSSMLTGQRSRETTSIV